MSRLVCACGTPIPRRRAGSEHCSHACAEAAAERERAATWLDVGAESFSRYSEVLPQLNRPVTPGEGMMAFLRDHPTLLDPAPADVRPRDVEGRYSGQTHSCLRCGQRAQVSYVVLTDDGPNRWLDLCRTCDTWMHGSS